MRYRRAGQAGQPVVDSAQARHNEHTRGKTLATVPPQNLHLAPRRTPGNFHSQLIAVTEKENNNYYGYNNEQSWNVGIPDKAEKNGVQVWTE